MSELKTIGNKLFKTELGSQKIELAITDDIKKLMQESLNNKNQYSGSAQKSIDALKEAKRLAGNWRDSLSQANVLIINLTQKANELGVDVPKEILSYKDTISKGVKDADNYVKIISKIQMDVPLS